LPYLLSNLVGIAAATFWNFRTNGRWTWKPEHAPLIRTTYSAAPATAHSGATDGVGD
jgi:putative flippase GtrA